MKNITAFLTALFLICAVLTGCASGTAASSDDSMPIITIGSDTYPPFVYLDDNGDPAGIDVETATEAFRRMGYRAVFKAINWEEKNQLLESDEIDCIWGCFSMDGRLDQYNWAGPYMVSRQVIAVNADSDITDFSGLAGKTIAVQSTSKPESILLGNPPAALSDIGQVLSLEDRAVQYASLDCGYVDAVAAHETAILQYMKDYDADFRILPEPLLVTGIGAAFSLQDTRGIAEKLKETMKEMREDGTMERIVGRYLENPEKYLEVDSLAY